MYLTNVNFITEVKFIIIGTQNVDKHSESNHSNLKKVVHLFDARKKFLSNLYTEQACTTFGPPTLDEIEYHKFNCVL